MDDEQIYQRGGSEEDVKRYAECNGAEENPTLDGWQKELGRQWYKIFEKETQAWYNALRDHDTCLMCGLDPRFILNVSKLISVEIAAAKEEGRAEERKEILGLIDAHIETASGVKLQDTAYGNGYKDALLDLRQSEQLAQSDDIINTINPPPTVR